MALETCENCKRTIGELEQAFVHEGHIVCKKCYDKLKNEAQTSPAIINNNATEVQNEKQAVCPYCKAELLNRKPPKRRSAFMCPTCQKEITVDPHQFIYPSIYLTEKQANYVGFLWQLDHWVFTKGGKNDYQRMKTELVKKFRAEPEVGDVIWGLMNKSLTECDQFERGNVQDLMKDFRKFEGQLKRPDN